MDSKLYITAFIGATLILTDSKLLRPIREAWSKKFKKSEALSALPQCQMCVGFWVGALLSILITKELRLILFFGLNTSFFSYLVAEIITILKKK